MFFTFMVGTMSCRWHAQQGIHSIMEFVNFPSYKPLFSAGISQPHLMTSSNFENQPPKLSPRSEVFDYPTIRDMTGFVLTALPDAWRRRLRRLRACPCRLDMAWLYRNICIKSSWNDCKLLPNAWYILRFIGLRTSVSFIIFIQQAQFEVTGLSG